MLCSSLVLQSIFFTTLSGNGRNGSDFESLGFVLNI